MRRVPSCSLAAARHCSLRRAHRSRKTTSTFAGGQATCSSPSSPKGGHREVSVTQHRGKSDFVHFIAALLTGTYAAARRVHLVLDNLNIHLRKCFVDILGQHAAGKLLGPRRVPLHPQTRQLAEHGRDRDRDPQSAVLGSTHAQQRLPAVRGRQVAMRSQRCPPNYPVEVHSSRCRPKTWNALRSIIYVLTYKCSAPLRYVLILCSSPERPWLA
jgi:hypothetical protein